MMADGEKFPNEMINLYFGFIRVIFNLRGIAFNSVVKKVVFRRNLKKGSSNTIFSLAVYAAALWNLTASLVRLKNYLCILYEIQFRINLLTNLSPHGFVILVCFVFMCCHGHVHACSYYIFFHVKNVCFFYVKS